MAHRAWCDLVIGGRGFVPLSRVATELGVPRRTLVRWCSTGRLSGARQIGKLWYVHLATLRARFQVTVAEDVRRELERHE
jgi:hypothetical protein